MLDRFGRILVGTDGWLWVKRLWVKMATADQAARVAKRMALGSVTADRVVPTPDASNRRRGWSSQAAHDRFMKFMEKHLVVFETRNAKRGV